MLYAEDFWGLEASAQGVGGVWPEADPARDSLQPRPSQDGKKEGAPEQLHIRVNHDFF